MKQHNIVWQQQARGLLLSKAEAPDPGTRTECRTLRALSCSDPYYKCYCYLPLYIFCGRELLLAKLRPSNIDASAGAKEEIALIVAQIRQSWPDVEIWLRADSGFCREELMV